MNELDTVSLKKHISDCDKVLIAFGEDVHNLENIKSIIDYVADKDYYILYLNEDNLKDIDSTRAANAYSEDSEEFKKYTKWLTMTLNHRLLIIEIGASFKNPNILRWPLEKIAFYNKQAFFIRINKSFYQIPKELGEKSGYIKGSIEDLSRLLND